MWAESKQGFDPLPDLDNANEGMNQYTTLLVTSIDGLS